MNRFTIIIEPNYQNISEKDKRKIITSTSNSSQGGVGKNRMFNEINHSSNNHAIRSKEKSCGTSINSINNQNSITNAASSKSEKNLQNQNLIKKCEKIIVKTFKNFIQQEEKLIEKLYEQYQTNQEVKNIILEMSIRLKDIEYLIKNQWSILKKFNLQESIYIEESKNLTENEKVI